LSLLAVFIFIIQLLAHHLAVSTFTMTTDFNSNAFLLLFAGQLICLRSLNTYYCFIGILDASYYLTS